ncbi:unnamed protein product, partial [Caenorhabditis brenneri]
QDPKYREFSDLPNNLLNRIVDEVEPIDRLTLRKVCRPLRQLLAIRNPGFRKISINSSGNHFGVAYDEHSRCYSIPEVECESEYEEESSEGWLLTGVVEITWWNYHKDGPDWKQESIIEGDVFEIASNDLAIVVGNERLSLDEFEIENMYPEFNELFLQTLSARNIKVQTKKLKLHYFDLEKLEFLRYFDVEEEIILYLWTNWETLPIDEIIGHPGIKNTRMLRVIMPDSTFPPDTILGFPRITVEFMRDFLSDGKTIEKLRKAILNSESLELFNITDRYKSSNMNEISKLLFPNAVEDTQNPNTSYVTVPDTGRTLELKLVEDELHFKRLEYKDPPTRNIYNLPLEILQKVLGGMNGKQRRISALVCKKFHDVISTIIPPYKYFRVNIRRSYTLLHFDDKYLGGFNYYDNGLGNEGFDTEMIFGDAFPLKRCGNRNNHQEIVLKDVYAFLNQPRLELEKMEIIHVFDKHWKDFGAVFEKLHQKVKTKEIHIRSTEKMEELQILPYLDPSFIEKIYLKINQESKDRMDKILELEQCKNVKMIEIRLERDGLENFQVESFMKFRKFALKFSVYPDEIEQFMAVIETLLTSTSLELARLNFLVLLIAEPIKRDLDKITEESPGNSRARRFLIPNSKEYFEIEFIRDTVIQIERKQ